MNKWLHYNGFSYKQPKGVPHKFDEAKQQAYTTYIGEDDDNENWDNW